MARWSLAAFPVEYKRGRLRHEQSYSVQLCAQAPGLEEMLSANVPEGALLPWQDCPASGCDL